ncbi:MAG TPA: hypothetical protein VFL92_07090 [Sphingomonas sp.]|nr:hypothetical protein [Sphingomonas sp.]
MTASAALPRSASLALLGALAAGAFALPQPTRADPPKRIESVVVYGNDPCPQSTGDEIVVCAREPESERYRIPQRFRGAKRKQSPASNAWSNKVTTTEAASRQAAGLPNTCSAVGTGGQTGCLQQFLARSRAERQQQKQQEQDAASGGPE